VKLVATTPEPKQPLTEAVAEHERSEPVEQPVTRRLTRPQRDPIDVAKAESDRAIAEAAGIAGSLDELLSGGPLDIDVDQLGGLLGVKGPGGSGLSRGSAFGTGGRVEASGGLGTRGRSGGRYGFGKLSGKRSTADLDLIVAQEAVYYGSMEPRLVDEVIRRHLGGIRHCYQRELQSQPELAGRVVVKFVIARDGGVATATVRDSSLGSAAAESCIAGQFMRMRFPTPRGGGIVAVSYPFLFSSR